MPNVIANNCYGGFGLSTKAILRYSEIKGIIIVPIKGNYGINYYVNGIVDDDHYFSDYDIKRDDPALVQVVIELGKDANGPHAELRVAEVPDGVEWFIDEYDGIETIREVHRTW